MARRKKVENPKSTEDLVDQWNNVPVLSDTERAIAELERERSRLKSKEHDATIKALRSELMLAQERLQVALDITGSDVTPIVIKANSRTALKEATPVFCASDWHVEERVDLEQVNGLNEYNPNIAIKRGKQYFESMLWLLDGHKSMAVIKQVILWLGGDLITGYIHEEFKESNWLSPTQAILLVEQIICGGIDLILAKTDVDIIIPCSFGNHGRTDPKKVISTAAQNSFEWLMYHHLKQRYAKNSRIKFIIADSYHLYMNVYDTTIRFSHGDHVKYGGGVGGMTIPINKKISAWNTSKVANLDVMGHFHQLFDGGKFIVNGSLIGWNSFAISIGASYEPPQQAFFLIRPGRGKSATAPIFVT